MSVENKVTEAVSAVYNELDRGLYKSPEQVVRVGNVIKSLMEEDAPVFIEDDGQSSGQESETS